MFFNENQGFICKIIRHIRRFRVSGHFDNGGFGYLRHGEPQP
jgi:hypothetical protein